MIRETAPATSGLYLDTQRIHPQSSLKQVAQEFESVLLNITLQSMRQSNDTFKSGLFSNSEQKMFEEMQDQQMVLGISQGNGVGLAAMIEKQLSPPAPSPAQNFVAQTWPSMCAAGKELGVDPKVLMAQAVLETGWGAHMPKESHNCFGIKENRRDTGVMAKTQEYTPQKQAYQTQAAFRAYQSPQDSVSDYVQFLKNNPRYQTALEHADNPQAFIQALARAGYATDPQYADKLYAVYQGQRLHEALNKVNHV
jgi:flagellar protein FlgJ